MSDWKEYKLSEIIDIIGGGTPKTSIPEYWNGDIPWLSVTDFNIGKKFVYDTEKKITELGFNNSSTKLLLKGDIIISARGTVGIISMLAKDMTFNQSCYGIKAKNDFSFNDYVYYLLKNNIENLSQISHGGVFDTITRETFNNVDIILPPLPEQQAIVDILSSLDDKIDLLYKQNKTLEAIAETIFRKWFVEEADPSWKIGKLSDLADHLKNSLSPKKMSKVIFDHFSIPAYDESLMPKKELGSSIQSNKYLLKNKTILFSKLNPHKEKRIWLIEKLYNENSICSTEFQVIKPKKDAYLYFLYLLLKYPEVYNEIASGIGGTSGSHQRIDPETIFNFKINLPNENYVIKFNEIVIPLFKKYNNNKVSTQIFIDLRDLLLPKLMTSEVRVKYNGGKNG